MVLEAGCRVIKVKVIKVYSMITLPELDSFPSEQNCVDNPVLDCKLGWWCCFQWSWCHELTHTEAKMLGMRTLRNLISSLSFQLPFCSGVPSKEGEELFCETRPCTVTWHLPDPGWSRSLKHSQQISCRWEDGCETTLDLQHVGCCSVIVLCGFYCLANERSLVSQLLLGRSWHTASTVALAEGLWISTGDSCTLGYTAPRSALPTSVPGFAVSSCLKVTNVQFKESCLTYMLNSWYPLFPSKQAAFI